MFNPNDPGVTRPSRSDPMDPDCKPWLVRPGDRARLKSGGAVMTVERIKHDGNPPFAECAWIDERKKLHKGYFTLDALTLVVTDE